MYVPHFSILTYTKVVLYNMDLCGAYPDPNRGHHNTAIGVNALTSDEMIFARGGCVAIGKNAFSTTSSAYYPKKCVMVGDVGIIPSRDYSVYVGTDLQEKEGNINFADVLTADSDTKIVSMKAVVSNSFSLSHDMDMTHVECCICETDEQRSIRAQCMRIRKRLEGTLIDISLPGNNILEIGPLTEADIEFANNYKPVLKPGFKWVHAGYERAMCINCIYEASFDFMAQNRLRAYTVHKNDQNDQGEKIAELQSRISKLETLIEKLISSTSKNY